ncbi:MAG TPA: hypothetical protein VF511_10185, partial [Chthoniobacterales bacterium]
MTSRFFCPRFPPILTGMAALFFATLPSPRAAAATVSDAERLERLERAVEILQKRNSELEQEVRSLKKEKSPAPPAPAPLAEEKRSHFAPDNKSVVEKSEVVAEKKPLFVLAGASEIKLVLGGFIQMQYEAGDVFAFEGRF